MPVAMPHLLARLLGVVIALLLFGAFGFTPKGQAQTPDSTLTVNAPSGGTVTSTPAGISCPPACTAGFDTGTQVTLTASAEDGFSFLKWEGDCTGQSETCNLTLDANAEVKAIFVAPTSGTTSEPPSAPTDSEPPAVSEQPPPVSESPPPTKPSPPAPAPVKQPAQNEIDRLLKALPFGSIAFNAPTALGLRESAEIELVLSLHERAAKLKHRISALGEKIGAGNIKVSKLMEARLTGLGWEVLALTPKVQAVAGKEVTTWRWQIRATEAGTRQLHLTLSALLDVDGSQSPRLVRTFDRVIEVQVSWVHRLSGFAGENWQWLWAAIAAPLVGCFLRKRRNTARPY